MLYFRTSSYAFYEIPCLKIKNIADSEIKPMIKFLCKKSRFRDFGTSNFNNQSLQCVTYMEKISFL